MIIFSNTPIENGYCIGLSIENKFYEDINDWCIDNDVKNYNPEQGRWRFFLIMMISENQYALFMLKFGHYIE